MRTIRSPFVGLLLERLRASGQEAYPVGGCVRDLLLGSTPHDWDVTTSATVEEMQAVFSDLRVIPVGARHGTLAVLSQEGECVEVTTFRTDGEYGDGRHPDAVRFTRSLREDLSRRDFTVNALCLAQDGSIIDLFGGQADLDHKIIRAIGDPFARFSEDALRILRGLRFASQLGFTIEPQTAAAMLQLKGRLSLLSAERVFSELCKLLCGKDVVRVLLSHRDILFAALPELAPQQGVYQRSDYHCYDVYEHTARSVGLIEPRIELRLAMLLHDTGKPECADGQGHFKGHSAAGEKRAEEILTRLKCPTALKERVTRLVRLHAITMPQEKRALTKLLAKHGEQRMFDLVAICIADNGAKRPDIAAQRIDYFLEIKHKLTEILAEAPPLSLRDMAVNGHDILTLGAEKGPQVGAILKTLWQRVLEQQLENDKAVLMAAAKRLLSERISD